MKKVLFVSHVANFIKFNEPYIKWFKEQGLIVHYASMGEEPVLCCDKNHVIPFSRSFVSPRNIKAYFKLKKLIEAENYDIVHCHTPSGGVIARLAARKARKNGTKVIYTCHGFHFYKGAPRYYWLVFYNIEKFCARFTDALVLINDEDYSAAINKRFKADSIYRINGTGVDLTRFSPATQDEKQALRRELGIEKDVFAMLYCAEFTANKNHRLIISAVPELLKTTCDIKILFVGKGALFEEAKATVSEMKLDKYISFHGYRKDIEKFYKACDAEISSSSREGLSVHVMEAMASGLPVVATNIRGHSDLITDGENGFLYERGNVNGFVDCVLKLIKSKDLERFRNENVNRVKKYSLPSALKQMAEIYKKYM